MVGAAWASGLRQRDDGWYPAFDRDVMVATIAAAVGPRWDEFARIGCPTLVVRGGAGSLDPDEYARMSRHPMVSAVEIPGAGHDVHLDSPDRWRRELGKFLAGIVVPADWQLKTADRPVDAGTADRPVSVPAVAVRRRSPSPPPGRAGHDRSRP
nr:alpha/beta hydrolase [Plantactinospora alkalitolerans]